MFKRNGSNEMVLGIADFGLPSVSRVLVRIPQIVVKFEGLIVA